MPQLKTTVSRDPWLTAGSCLFALGCLLQLWLSARSWFYFDQVLLYRLGIEGLASGQLFPFAKAVSGSGVIPGALLEILVAAPLAVWMDFRSPIVLLGLFQVAGGAILWRTSARIFGEPTAAIFVAVYWLGPWRLYHSGFLWEPTYLLLPAALHLWASVRSFEKPHIGSSMMLGLVSVAAVQLHPSGAVLGATTVLLLLSGRQHLNPGAALAGVALGGVTMIPTALARWRGTMPSTVNVSDWTELGLVRVYPLFKDLIYWLRLGSLDVGRRIRQSQVTESWEWLTVALGALAAASVLVALLANIQFVRCQTLNQEQSFVRTYCAAALVAHVAAMALSTVTPQGWHLLVVLHAASVPVAWMLARTLTSGSGSRVLLTAVWLVLLLRLPIAAVLGLAHPMYVVPKDDPNRPKIERGDLETIELVPIPFGGDASVRGEVPWEQRSQ